MKNIFSIVLYVFCLGIFSCEENPSSNNGGGVQNTDYIGSIGESVYVINNTMIDLLGNILSKHVDTMFVRVSIDTQNVGGYSPSIKMAAYSKRTDLLNPNRIIASSSAVNWYRKSNDTVYSFASSGIAPGFGFPKSSNISHQQKYYSEFEFPYAVIQKIRSERIQLDSISLSEFPRAVYILPLYSGKEWQMFNQPYAYIRRVRRVEGVEQVTTQAGTFQCFKIRSSLIGESFKDNELWYDYVSREGVISRTVEFPILITTESNPDGDGRRATVYETLELISRK